jgi:hypothetical protein
MSGTDESRSAGSFGHRLDVIERSDIIPQRIERINNIQLTKMASRAKADAAPAKVWKKVSVSASTPVESANICFTDSCA